MFIGICTIESFFLFFSGATAPDRPSGGRLAICVCIGAELIDAPLKNKKIYSRPHSYKHGTPPGFWRGFLGRHKMCVTSRGGLAHSKAPSRQLDSEELLR